MGSQEREGRLWSRMGRNLLVGAGLGAAVGAVTGALLGAFAFDRAGAAGATAAVGAIALAIVGGFAALLAGLESPEPGEEPSSVDRPVRDVPELTKEEGSQAGGA